jgi:HAD superfamily hydrolase (TIGR01549 family)
MKTVIFDFDGTLASSFSLITYCFLTVLKEYGIEMTPEELQKHYGPSEDGMLVKFLGEEKGKEAFKEYQRIYSEKHEEYIPALSSGCFEILSELKNKNIPLVLVTGRSRETWNISADKLHIASFFKKVYTGSPEGVNKPISFAACQRDFGLDKKDMLYVGDSLMDIESCSTFGIKLISVSYNHTSNVKKLEKGNPGHVAHNGIELKNLLDSFLNS